MSFTLSRFILVVLPSISLLVLGLFFVDFGGKKLASHFAYSFVELTFIPYSFLVVPLSYLFGTYSQIIVNVLLIYLVLSTSFSYARHKNTYKLDPFYLLILLYPVLYYYSFYALRDVLIFYIVFHLFLFISNKYITIFFLICLFLLRPELVFIHFYFLFKLFKPYIALILIFLLTIIFIFYIDDISKYFGLSGITFNSFQDFAYYRNLRQFKLSEPSTAFLGPDVVFFTFSTLIKQFYFFLLGGIHNLFYPVFHTPYIFNIYSVLENIIFLITFFFFIKSFKLYKSTIFFTIVLSLGFVLIFGMSGNYINLLRLKMVVFAIIFAITLKNRSLRNLSYA